MSNLLTNLSPGICRGFFMNNFDTLANHLRMGGLILVKDKSKTWLLGSVRHPDAFEKVVREANIPYKGAYILIGSMDNLFDHVLRFSDLAWDIAGESEKALLIWYDNPKSVPPALKDEQDNVPLMLNRCKTLQPLLQKHTHGLITLLLPPNEQGWQALPDVLPLSVDAECRLLPERIMRLSAGGDVKFLKY